jgi:hypothetical protein
MIAATQMTKQTDDTNRQMTPTDQLTPTEKIS